MPEPIVWRGNLGIQVDSRNPVTGEPHHRTLYLSRELELASQEAMHKPPADADTKPKKFDWLRRFMSRSRN